MIIVGIGIVPAVGALADMPVRRAAAGLMSTNIAGRHCRISFAIGDCAAHANDFAGGAVMRVESVQNANDMANAVAKIDRLASIDRVYRSVPWFWSNQYDLQPANNRTVGGL